MADVLTQKLAVITIDVDNGKVVSVVGQNGAVVVDPAPEQELEPIYQGAAGLKHVGAVIHTHSSPGCVYWWQGHWIKVC